MPRRRGPDPGEPALAQTIEAYGSIKKLPQAGQEPVEAVESERSGPDTPHDTRTGADGKDIAQKNRLFVVETQAPHGFWPRKAGKPATPDAMFPSFDRIIPTRCTKQLERFTL
jgi:hypothetical protein